VKKVVIEKSFIEAVFPADLLDYFEITNYQVLCSVKEKLEYWLIDFQERNELPNGLSFNEYETKDFTHPKLVQDFPIRGKGVYLRIKKRRWRHKHTGQIIKRDYSFIAEGSKFTHELSDFLKDTGGYATRYHNEYSQLLPGE
jgi:hypothetical protein